MIIMVSLRRARQTSGEMVPFQPEKELGLGMEEVNCEAGMRLFGGSDGRESGRAHW